MGWKDLSPKKNKNKTKHNHSAGWFHELANDFCSPVTYAHLRPLMVACMPSSLQRTFPLRSGQPTAWSQRLRPQLLPQGSDWLSFDEGSTSGPVGLLAHPDPKNLTLPTISSPPLIGPQLVLQEEVCRNRYHRSCLPPAGSEGGGGIHKAEKDIEDRRSNVGQIMRLEQKKKKNTLKGKECSLVRVLVSGRKTSLISVIQEQTNKTPHFHQQLPYQVVMEVEVHLFETQFVSKDYQSVLKRQVCFFRKL